MKICYVVPSLKEAGPIIVVKDLVMLFQSRGHSCHVVYLDEMVDGRLSFACLCIPLRNIKEADWEKYDLIHAHGLRPTVKIAKVKKNHASIPVVTTMHNYVFQDFIYEYGIVKGIAGSFFYLWYARRFDKIVVLCRDAMEYYGRYLPESRLDYIYNSRVPDPRSSLSEDERKEFARFSPDSIVLGTISVLNKRKGIDKLIRALNYLSERFKLIVIGDGPERTNLEQLTRSLGLDARIWFAGKRKNGYRFLPVIDCFALPSKSEGFPLALLEAASVGKCIAASRLPAVREVFCDDEIIFFEASSPRDIAARISLIESSDLRRDLGTAAWQKYQTVLSPNLLYERHLKLYVSLIEPAL